MPKECRRKTSKDFGVAATAITEGSRPERRSAASKPSQIRDELLQTAARVAPSPASGAPAVMDARRVPQVTITPEGGGSSREMQQEDWDDMVDGALRRRLSNSSISSTGSSAVESEDDLLSDSESKSKGIITLEHLGDTGEVSALHGDDGVVKNFKGEIKGGSVGGFPGVSLNNNNNLSVVYEMSQLQRV